MKINKTTPKIQYPRSGWFYTISIHWISMFTATFKTLQIARNKSVFESEHSQTISILKIISLRMAR